MNERLPPCRRGPRRQAGELLLEVLIAVLILGIGLLGIAAMQATALRNNHSAMQRSQAVVLITTLLDAMRVNRSVSLAGGYALGRTCTVPAAGSLAATDLNGWMQSLHSMVGASACGTVSCSSGLCTVTVDWDDSRASDASASGVGSGAARYSVSLSSQL